MSELRQVLKRMSTPQAQKELYEKGLKFSERAAIQWANETLENPDKLHQYEEAYVELFSPVMGLFLVAFSLGALLTLLVTTL